MAVYYRKRKLPAKVQPERVEVEENWVDKGISFLKGFLRDGAEVAGEVLERKVRERIRRQNRRLR